ncbi:SIMPL domain-containing protein [uncultured Sphingomonas sp.]|uniref:SIMPL domain-containing protein n=1 Tax=uncultured Sphingomonas sp. TaxID=158754 RepID=UPI0035CAA6E2
MRRMIGLAALLLAGQSTAQSAAAPGAPLRPGEIALHIVARGEVTTRADRITLSVSVNGGGRTLPEARASADAGVARLTAALISVGVDRASIVAPVGTRLSFDDPIERSAAMVQALADGNISGGRVAQRTTATTLRVTVPDRATLDRAMQVMAAQEGVSSPTPKPMLRDEAAARHAAVAAAMARARHDADDYAEPLGLKVTRITAVANSTGLVDGGEVFTRIVNEFQDKTAEPDAVTTRATAAVDFVLAPR